MKLPNKRESGFTIVEVLIVLAIVGLIMAMIFLAVPALRRIEHNNSRKRAVALTLDVILNYPADHDGKYPFTTNGLPDPATWNEFYDGYIKGTELENYTFNILSLDTTDYSYIGPLNEITVSSGHWCNSDPASNDSITGDGKRSTDAVVWTKIEGSKKAFCLDAAIKNAP